MTTWGEGRDGETEGDEDNRVQVEIDADATDIWLVFNRKTSAVQWTHAEALEFMNEFSKALGEARAIGYTRKEEE